MNNARMTFINIDDSLIIAVSAWLHLINASVHEMLPNPC